MEHTYSHSSLSSFRRCPRKFYLSYQLRLTPLAEREALSVGSCWHHAFEQPKETEFYSWFYAHAPSELWAEKLFRLHSAHQAIYANETFEIVEVERTFDHELACATTGDTVQLRGQIDLTIKLPDGRTGILERKTTSSSLDDGSDYWNVLGHGTQVGIYGLAAGCPDVILYDVVRKPTIRPKRLSKAAAQELLNQVNDWVEEPFYCGEAMPMHDVKLALETGEETERMYGARLAKDIVERPEYYFARREVTRTSDDYSRLVEDLHTQVAAAERMRDDNIGSERCSYYRNPDACGDFGGCEFQSICWRSELPIEGQAPDGFRVRKHRHPELDGDN